MKKIRGIEINPEIMFGKLVFTGTRIPIEIVLDKLEAGQTFNEILEDYPRLTEEDIKAAIAFANRLVKKVSLAHPYVPATLHKISR